MPRKLETAEAINQTFSFLRKEFTPLLLAMNMPMLLMVVTPTIQWLVYGPPTDLLGLLPTVFVWGMSMTGYSMAVYQRVVLGREITPTAMFRLFTSKGMRVFGPEAVRLVLVGFIGIGWFAGVFYLERFVMGGPAMAFGIAGAVGAGLLCLIVHVYLYVRMSFVSSMYACVRSGRFRVGVRMTEGYRLSVFGFWFVSSIIWGLIELAVCFVVVFGVRASMASDAASAGALVEMVICCFIFMINFAYLSAGSALFFRNAAKRMIAEKKYGAKTGR